MARIPMCSMNSFTVRTLRECGRFIPGGYTRGQITWRSTRTKKQTGSVAFSADENGITLQYTWTPYGGESQQMQERIEWDWLQVGFGRRPYFECPVCGKRCARIAFRGGRWGCKQCAGACSDTENDRPYYRLMARCQKIREERLKWKPGESWGERPKGMHKRTFFRLVEQAEELDQRSLRIISRMWC